MKTKKDFGSISNTKIDRPIHILLIIMVIIAMTFMAIGLAGCSTDHTTKTDPDQTGELMGTVKDEDGNPYPSTLITISKESEKLDQTTTADGKFQGTTNDIGIYNVEMALPLSTVAVSANPTTVSINADQATQVDFVIKPLPVEGILNFGDADIFEEISDENGNLPTDPNEPLYAANFFENPIGLLTAIKTPEGHHVTLSEYQQARGTLKVYCNGESTTVEIELEGMIPNGTYTAWLGFLKTTKGPGEAISPSDFVYPVNPPLGAQDGSENVLVADSEGKVNVTIEHASCILTDEVALGMPVSYHLNGNTYGSGVIPDVEEVTQLLFYFL